MHPRNPDAMAGMKVVTETSDSVHSGFGDADYRYKGRKYRVQFRKFALVFGPTQTDAARRTVGRRFSSDHGMRVIGVAKCDGHLPFCAPDDTIVVVSSLPATRGHSAKKRTWSAVADSFISTFALVPHTVVLNKAPTQRHRCRAYDTEPLTARAEHPSAAASPLVAILEWMTRLKARKGTRGIMDTRAYMHERKAPPEASAKNMQQMSTVLDRTDDSVQEDAAYTHDSGLERSKAMESGIMLLMDFAKSTSNIAEFRPIHLVGT